MPPLWYAQASNTNLHHRYEEKEAIWVATKLLEQKTWQEGEHVIFRCRDVVWAELGDLGAVDEDDAVRGAVPGRAPSPRRRRPPGGRHRLLRVAVRVALGQTHRRTARRRCDVIATSWNTRPQIFVSTKQTTIDELLWLANRTHLQTQNMWLKYVPSQ